MRVYHPQWAIDAMVANDRKEEKRLLKKLEKGLPSEGDRLHAMHGDFDGRVKFEKISMGGLK